MHCVRPMSPLSSPLPDPQASLPCRLETLRVLALAAARDSLRVRVAAAQMPSPWSLETVADRLEFAKKT